MTTSQTHAARTATTTLTHRAWRRQVRYFARRAVEEARRAEPWGCPQDLRGVAAAALVARLGAGDAARILRIAAHAAAMID